MARSWRCGDCGTVWPNTVKACRRPFDDYLSLRGGSIESAIALAVWEGVAPLVRRAEQNLNQYRSNQT